MKKGCFIKTVIIGTVLIASVVYIIENKLDDWVISPGKKFVLNKIVQNWDKELKYVYASPQKDSLKNLLNYYVENIESLDDVANEDEKSFSEELNSVLKDSIITKDELTELTLFVKKEINEKPKSN
ncbi:MAG: hypothetical protein P8X47_08400 [Ignavibacteriaceae bacterium]